MKSIFDLQHFATATIETGNTLASTEPTYLNTNTTDPTRSPGMSAEMKTFYDKNLLREVGPNLVHDQFGQKRNIPRNGGKTIEFRKYNSLPKALQPLTEGITPNGSTTSVSTITATPAQYGNFIATSDVLEMTAIDPVITENTRILGDQAGRTLDTITRNIMQSGTNVSYADKVSSGVHTPVNTRADLTSAAVLTPDEIVKASIKLENQNAKKINGSYVGIIHPLAKYDLIRNPEFIEWHKYAKPDELYKNEIGELGGVRFVTSTEAKIYHPAITSGSATLTVKTNTSSSTTVPVKEAITAADVAAYAARDAADKYLYIDGTKTAVSALVAGDAGSATITLGSAASLSADKVIADFANQGTKTGDAVFGTLIMGADAYATTEPTGLGLEMIVKQKGSAGTADPLDQRSTVGWKAMKTAVLLNPAYIVRVEHCSAQTIDAAKEN